MDKERLHYHISMHKSAWRLIGYGLILYSIPAAVAVLILSEVLGIAEEVWGA